MEQCLSLCVSYARKYFTISIQVSQGLPIGSSSHIAGIIGIPRLKLRGGVKMIVNTRFRNIRMLRVVSECKVFGFH